MYVSGVASDPLCRDRYPRFQETKSNLPPTVVRVRSEQIEGCQARQSTDPHKLRGSKPQQGSLTSVLDTHRPRQRAQQSLGLTVLVRAKGVWLGFSSAMLQTRDYRDLSKASTDIRNHQVLFQANTRHAHGREFKLLVYMHANRVR